MRITCRRCGAKARILSSADAMPGYGKMYCQCTNVECGRRFVATWSELHSLCEGKNSDAQQVAEAINALTDEQKHALLSQLTAKNPALTGLLG